MKRENFILLIDAIQKQFERERLLVESLQRFFDGHFVSGISSTLINTLISALSSEMNDPEMKSRYGSMIDWWLFDAPEGGKSKDSAYVQLLDGRKITLHDAGQLYDYLAQLQGCKN